MAKAKTAVGLDVHATKIVAAVLDVETGELSRFSMNGETDAAAGFCAGLRRPAWVAYEAGPTGYGLARELARRGVECVVAAPSKIPRASGDRVKTDRRDAEHLVRLLVAGKLHPVRVPGPEEEALRDLVCAREQVRVDLMRSRHRLSKLLLRHGIRSDDGAAWTTRHREWLQTVTLPWPAAQSTLSDCHAAIDVLCLRRDGLEREILALLPTSPWAVQVGRLRCLRRDRHADRGRVVRGDRRFRTVREGRAADELPRTGPVREHHRPATPARVDHQDRIRARPAAAGQSRLALPPTATERQSAD
jgi:transposase